MATWKKIIVSGSNAELAQVTASIGVLVGSNQFIGTTQATTRLTGSFTGSFAGGFTGDGTGLTGVTATPTFPSTATTDLSSTHKFFINDDAGDATSGNKKLTYGNLLTDLAGSGISVEGTDSLSVNSGSMQTFFNSSSYAGVSGDILINTSTGVATIQANSVALGTDTTGDYVTSVSASGALVSSALSGEGSAPNITLNTASTTFTSGVVSALPSATVSGSSFSSPSQGTVRATINGVNTDVDTGLQTADSPTFVDVTLTGDIAVNGGDITTTAGTLNIATGTATTINVGTTGATTVSIGNSSSTTTVGNNLIVPGDLTVNGTLVNLNVNNVNIEDQFILLASGSAVGLDAGIVASSGSLASGSAMYHDITDGRWSVAKGIGTNATSVTPLEYVTTVKLASGAPSTQEYGKGEMYINTADDSVWIYS